MPKLLGQPPRVRGRQPAGDGRVLDVRTTPAGAGTTWTAAWVKDAPEEAGVALARLIASPGYPFDERAARATAERITDTGIQDAEAQSHQIGAQWHGPAISTIIKPTLCCTATATHW